MKKLKLKALHLGANEILTRDQLKNVLGGDAANSRINRFKCCSVFNNDNCSECLQPNLTCGAEDIPVGC